MRVLLLGPVNSPHVEHVATALARIPKESEKTLQPGVIYSYDLAIAAGGTTHTLRGDYIEAASWAVVAAVTGGDVEVTGVGEHGQLLGCREDRDRPQRLPTQSDEPRIADLGQDHQSRLSRT